MENGPVEIVSFPIKHGGSFHSTGSIRIFGAHMRGFQHRPGAPFGLDPDGSTTGDRIVAHRRTWLHL